MTHAGDVVVFGLIEKKCEACGQDAILDEAGPAGKLYYERVFVCPRGHKTVRRDGTKGAPKEKTAGIDEMSALEKLNRFLDDLEGKGNA